MYKQVKVPMSKEVVFTIFVAVCFWLSWLSKDDQVYAVRDMPDPYFKNLAPWTNK